MRVFEVCEGSLVTVDDVAAILRQVEYALRARLLFPENLPEIATQLMADGADSPALRILAGLDLSPVDPRDARDQFTKVLNDFAVAPQPTEDHAEAIAALLSYAYLHGRISLHRLLKMGHQATIAFDYPDQPEIMLFFEIGDEWGSGWGRSDDELKEVITTAATELAGRHPAPSEHLLRAISRSA